MIKLRHDVITGLVKPVLLDGAEVKGWKIYPLEFKKDFIQRYESMREFNYNSHWRIQGGTRDAHAPSLSHFFHFHVLAKSCQIIGFSHKLGIVAPCLENPAFATDGRGQKKYKPVVDLHRPTFDAHLPPPLGLVFLI